MSIVQDLDVTILDLKEDKSRTTRFSADQLAAVELATKQLSEANEDNTEPQIALSVLSRPEPIVIRNLTTITLGRADRQRNAIPTVDLSNDNALGLGVSRLHAKLLYVDGCFYLKDMGSTNGTWLNGVRLARYEIVAIDHGDQIRLGRLIMIVL